MPAKKKRARKSHAGKTRKKVSRRKRSSRKRKTTFRSWRRWIGYGALLVAALFALWVVYLDITIREQFTGRRWALPAHVYTRPMELYVGAKLTPAQLLSELKALGYQSGSLDRPGTYQRAGEEIRLRARQFDFWDGTRPVATVTIGFAAGSINHLRGASGRLDAFRLEPRLFGSVLPNRHEDRSLVRLQDVPEPLIKALLSIEDRNYYQHIGIDPRGLARALWANLTAGGLVQGGSTITQQLVKNFYLNAERTWRRKFTEMIMALLLEWHYSKQDILETYINEVYLGQAGNRAIHGFGLASQFYFGRPLAELKLPELALLAALVKGPSYYNPRRHPQRARQRRDLVLNTMAALRAITSAQAAKARQSKLNVSPGGSISATAYPAYLDLVRWQLQRDYRPQDLSHEGLRIFTTLEPQIQQQVERAVAAGLTGIERQRGLQPGSLQTAVIVLRSDNGEVQALAGGRRRGYAGFNRALLAQRPVGSLVKPALYLAALEQPGRYTLASRLLDTPLTLKQPGAPDWRPQNYDRSHHGEVLLLDALVHSYNLASVRLGMDLGVAEVVSVLQRLGLRRELQAYPSLLLGAASLTPIEVSQLYLTLASGGFRTPMRAVREVMTHEAQPLARYPLNIEQVVEPPAMALLNYALQQVVRRGTAAGLSKRFPSALGLAGKTGTTDGFRDSWFAGYSGNYLTVVWVGRDDNKPTGLTGAAGAMQIWADIMSRLDLTAVPAAASADIEYRDVGLVRDGRCLQISNMPFINGSAPADVTDCDGGAASRTVPRSQNRFLRWLKGLIR